MIKEIITCIGAGMNIGFTAIVKAATFYNALQNIKTEILAAIIGVPAIVLTAIGILRIALKLLIRKKQ